VSDRRRNSPHNSQQAAIQRIAGLLGLAAFSLAPGARLEPAQPTKSTIVTVASACSCPLCGGKWRWSAKTDKESAPATVPPANRITPADLAQWPGPGGSFHSGTPRDGRELEWFELTGQLRHARIEKDGDITLELSNIGSSIRSRLASVEIPNGEPWCAVREQLFSLTAAKFPFRFTHNADLWLRSNPVISVTGRAFYDAEHAGTSSRNNIRKGAGRTITTVWEIHPVMTLKLVRR
jgi:hypothetical protein